MPPISNLTSRKDPSPEEGLETPQGMHGPNGFWRQLDEEMVMREVVERRYPDLLATWEDPTARRSFLKLMGASVALAVAGCNRAPPESIVPYVRAPEDQAAGESLYYATAAPRPSGAMGILVKSHMGRPIKIEGNSDHPASLGATDAAAQAAILTFYDPDRSQTVKRQGGIATWEIFFAQLAKELSKLRPRGGEGLHIFTESIHSPTLRNQLGQVQEVFPNSKWHVFDAIHRDSARRGALEAFGRDLAPIYRFEAADVIVSLDSDFLTDSAAGVRYAHDFSLRRRGTGEPALMNRLYVFESTPTITGASADYRFPLSPQQLAGLAYQLAGQLQVPGIEASSGGGPSITEQILSAVAEDLLNARGRALVVAGAHAPADIHALVHAINAHLDARGNTVDYIEPIAPARRGSAESAQELVAAIEQGEVELLLILGGNPAYQMPGELRFREALLRVPFSAHLSEFEDETSACCKWHLPAAHFLESWGDARAYDGAASIIQPLIEPLYGGKSPHEILSLLLDDQPATAYEIVQKHWQNTWNSPDFARRWAQAIHDGVITESKFPTIEAKLQDPKLDSRPGRAFEKGIALSFRADEVMGDGRDANNAWLQELPKALTKLTWDNVVMLSPATAARLGARHGEVLEISRGGRTIEAPAWIMPGQADDCATLTLGYGRARAGTKGTAVGYDAFQLAPGDGSWFAVGEIRPTGRMHSFAQTQSHHSMEGRDIIRVRALANASATEDHDGAKHPTENLPSLYPEYDYASEPNAWGMVIDQTACIGCNACVVACQAENNIPVVGKEQVQLGREMHWIRIDRYYHGEAANPETYFQPMMCVHCEKAPCEVVCPVAATVHDSEGTNNMVYNRCVGTRYCSNNCPYKVRRFNYLQYSDETTPSLALLYNPDVTVRSRGVMEKCTYCIQRISGARIAAKREDRAIADGEVRTACQQACPTSAIVFGNLNDPKSKVAALKKSKLNYGVLAELNTQPRTTFLPRLINENPVLPARSAISAGRSQPAEDRT